MRTSCKWLVVLHETHVRESNGSNEYNESKELYDLEYDSAEEHNLSGKNLEIESILWKKIQEYI